jgi:hypothetical protein
MSKFQVGDYVYNDALSTAGTVIMADLPGYFDMHIRRNDGQLGVGVEGSWVTSSENTNWYLLTGTRNPILDIPDQQPLPPPRVYATKDEHRLQAIYVAAASMTAAVDLHVIGAGYALHALEGTLKAFVEVLDERFGDSLTARVQERLTDIASKVATGELPG